jgi:CheY-like chemotaxis protein
VSLSGSVEDLPLLEILQVVSFCQKTGNLTVRLPAGEAGVVFEAGRVVAGYAWDVPAMPPAQPPPGPARELVVRQRIASLLERLVRFREGDFAFHLAETVPTELGGRDLSGEMLPYGINPEEMMLDLARQLDEDRRDAAATLEASFAMPEADDVVLEELPPEDSLPEEPLPEELPAPEPQAQEAPRLGPPVLLVDDEPEIRRVLGERLLAAGFDVHVCATPASARREMDRLGAAHGRFLLVTDLVLPTDSGASFRGGLDLARHATGLAAPPPVLLMAEAIDERLRARAKRLGVSILAWKPGLSKLDPRQYEADLRAFGDKLARDLLPRLDGRRRGTASAAAPPPHPAPPGATGRETVLRSALEEIRRTPDADLVAFVLLRVARAFFPRVVLFVVKDDSLRGLSGFGATDSGDSLDLLARQLSVPLDMPSAFSAAVATGRAWAGPLPADGPVRELLDRIGPVGAVSAAILPVRAHREAVAVLYGDAPDGGEIPPIEGLVAFVEEAGRALGEALLARRAPGAASC